MCRLNTHEPVGRPNPMVSPNFEFLVYEAEDEENEEIPDEISRLLKQERKNIQPYGEAQEVINLGTEEDKKEIKIEASLDPIVKKQVIELLKEYVDIFAWSYRDMSGLDTDSIVHRLPLLPECPPIKQKLRRTRPDMALKIKEEV